MSVHDTRDRYGLVSILNHWAVAVIVIVLLVTGLIFEDMPRGEAREGVIFLHNAIGALTFVIVAFRLGWRWAHRFPSEPPGPHWQAVAARIAHWLLLAGVAVVTLSGPFIVWTAGAALPLFGTVAIPSPFGGPVWWLHEVLEVAHVIAAKLVLMPLIALHVLAALKRSVIDRDGTLGRMIRPAGYGERAGAGSD